MQIIAPKTVQAIHFGRVVLPVAIDYRSGIQFLLLSVSNLSVFDDHGMEAGSRPRHGGRAVHPPAPSKTKNPKAAHPRRANGDVSSVLRHSFGTL